MKIEFLEKLSSNREPNKVSHLDLFISVPYIVEFRKLELVKSRNACLLMGRFEQLFSKYPSGFYKYKQPCKAQSKLEGLCWREELGMTRTELDSAFNLIVQPYRSRADYIKSSDRFKGKYYCSYVETQDFNKTIYFRNNELVDKCFEQLLSDRVAKE
jgi:hypothetical protein